MHSKNLQLVIDSIKVRHKAHWVMDIPGKWTSVDSWEMSSVFSLQLRIKLTAKFTSDDSVGQHFIDSLSL